MERLSPKGDKSVEAVPLGRMGDGGECFRAFTREQHGSSSFFGRNRRDCNDGNVFVFQSCDLDHGSNLCKSQSHPGISRSATPSQKICEGLGIELRSRDSASQYPFRRSWSSPVLIRLRSRADDSVPFLIRSSMVVNIMSGCQGSRTRRASSTRPRSSL